jgi:hypothetical protein
MKPAEHGITVTERANLAESRSEATLSTTLRYMRLSPAARESRDRGAQQARRGRRFWRNRGNGHARCANLRGTMVEALGIEAGETVLSTRNHVDSRQEDAVRVDVSTRSRVAFGPCAKCMHSTVEEALAKAIEGAVAARQWEVVGQLARELEAHRLPQTCSKPSDSTTAPSGIQDPQLRRRKGD